MRIVETKVYTIEELSEKAKENAREWYLQGQSYFEWWEFIYTDAEEIGVKILQFDLERQVLSLRFEQPAVTIAKNIKKSHGESCSTYRSATEFLTSAAGLHVLYGKDFDGVPGYWHIETEFKSALREDYFLLLKNEIEYQQSDECVDETIQANEYTFTEDGERFG